MQEYRFTRNGIGSHITVVRAGRRGTEVQLWLPASACLLKTGKPGAGHSKRASLGQAMVSLEVLMRQSLCVLQKTPPLGSPDATFCVLGFISDHAKQYLGIHSTSQTTSTWF